MNAGSNDTAIQQALAGYVECVIAIGSDPGWEGQDAHHKDADFGRALERRVAVAAAIKAADAEGAESGLSDALRETILDSKVEARVREYIKRENKSDEFRRGRTRLDFFHQGIFSRTDERTSQSR